jgi:hypothetical protein
VAATPIAAPAARRTIAPRFAARLAEESARARAAAEAVREPAPQPAPVAAAPSPAPAEIATPTPTPAPPPAPIAETASPAVEAEKPLPDIDLGALEDDVDSAPARQPRTLTGRESPSPAAEPARIATEESVVPPTPFGRTTMPSRLAEDDDDEGPLTLASMLPDASEWPRRPEPRKRGKRKSPAAAPPPTAKATTEVAAPADAPAHAAAESSHDARFLREARRDARWSRPWVRASLSIALVALALGAGAQLAWPMRDSLAAHYPATRPAWDFACEQLGCTIEAPRSVESLALDGSALTRTNTEHVLLFSADLHNRSDQEVRMPSFDLTFMDLNGEIVARKVLSPEQVGIHQRSLAPDADLHVHARLQVGSLDASGFQAALFYP